MVDSDTASSVSRRCLVTEFPSTGLGKRATSWNTLRRSSGPDILPAMVHLLDAVRRFFEASLATITRSLPRRARMLSK